ncbi:hypothetical protein Q7P37_009066 [Cladosporium fusiforme]
MSRVDGLTCDICNVFCGQQRAFKAHLRTIEHAKNAGQPLPEQFPCPQCEKGFTRKAGVERHLRSGQCRGTPTPDTSSMSPCRKRSLNPEPLEKPTKHMRTDSGPTNSARPQISDDYARSDRDTLAPMVAESISVRVVEMRKHGKVTDVTSPIRSPPNPLTFYHQEDSDAPNEAAPTETLADNNNNTTTNTRESLSKPYTANTLQVPYDTSTVSRDESHEASDDVTPLSDAMNRVSLEVNPSNLTTDSAKDGQRNSLAKRPRSSTAGSILSMQSKHSVASLGSLGSLFLNRSPRGSVSGSLRRSLSSSTKDSSRRTTLSDDMPAPMLQPIDEELQFSRKQESFWDRYKLRRGPQNIFGWQPHPAFLWDYAAQGNVEGIRRTLSFGKVDVNSPDQYGWTALLTASSHGYADIVELLLQRKDIDVEYQDAQGSTALSWAASNGHLEVVKLLLASGKVERHRENGIGCAALTWATMKGHSEIVSLLMKELFHESTAASEAQNDGEL